VLKIDRRFSLAAADISRILGSAAPPEVESKFQNGRWMVYSNAREVGSLPSNPSFVEQLDLLSGWASTFQPERKISAETHFSRSSVAGTLEITDVDEVFKQLQAANTLWKDGRRAEALQLSLFPMAILAFHQQTRMETGDGMQAKALAIFAIARSLNVPRDIRAETLLARALGYCQESCDFSRSLPVDDPVSAFVNRTAITMMSIEDEHPGDGDMRYMVLRRMSELADYTGWNEVRERWFTKAPPFPVLQTALNFRHFETELSVAAEMLDCLGRLGDSAPKTMENIDNKTYFECVRELVRGELKKKIAAAHTRIDSYADRIHGPLLDGSTVRDFYNSSLNSALYLIGTHYLDPLSPSGAAAQFSQTIGSAGADDVSRWYSPLAAVKTKQGSFEQLIQVMQPSSPIGAHALMDIFDALPNYVDFRESQGQQACKQMFFCMDSRPHDRKHCADIAYDHLLDLPLAKQLYSSAIDSGWWKIEFSILPWFTAWTGDRNKLDAFLSDPDLREQHKLHVLNLLQWMHTSDTKFIASWYQKLLRSYPDNWAVAKDYVAFLKSSGDDAHASIVLRDWLQVDAHRQGIAYIEATAGLAEMTADLGDTGKAFAEIESVSASNVLEVLKVKGEILQRLGKSDEAIQCARMAAQLYPDNKEACALLTKCYWQNGRYEDAAKVIRRFLPRLTLANLDSTQMAFVDVFSKRPAEGLRAFHILTAQEAGGDLFYKSISAGCAKSGSDQLAFEIQNALAKATADYILAYQYLKEWKGKDPALQWLRTKIGQQKSWLHFVEVAYELKQYELLWDVLPSEQTESRNVDSQRIWLIRAASYVRGGGMHKSDLIAHFSAAGAGEDYQAGRFLMDLAAAPAILHPRNSVPSICAASYVLGLKAQQQHDLNAATDWYRLVVETSNSTLAEYRWSYYQLLDWKSNNSFFNSSID
jgi:tetratricopeptide (TPR) repeat protein